MRDYDCKTRHETLSVNGLDVFYRHAGDRKKPGLLMLHGLICRAWKRMNRPASPD